MDPIPRSGGRRPSARPSAVSKGYQTVAITVHKSRSSVSTAGSRQWTRQQRQRQCRPRRRRELHTQSTIPTLFITMSLCPAPAHTPQTSVAITLNSPNPLVAPADHESSVIDGGREGSPRPPWKRSGGCGFPGGDRVGMEGGRGAVVQRSATACHGQLCDGDVSLRCSVMRETCHCAFSGTHGRRGGRGYDVLRM